LRASRRMSDKKRSSRSDVKRTFSFRTHLAGIFAGISAFRFSFGQDLFALTNR
jgi:hypothetical protein